MCALKRGDNIMKKYTMEEIGMFINEIEESQIVMPNEFVANIPLVGRKMFEKAALDDKKIRFFKREYLIAINRPDEEQQAFIEKMTPILNDYYGVEDKLDVKKR
jgi:hypothetical protein